MQSSELMMVRLCFMKPDTSCEFWGFYGGDVWNRGLLDWYPTTTVHGVTTQKMEAAWTS